MLDGGQILSINTHSQWFDVYVGPQLPLLITELTGTFAYSQALTRLQISMLFLVTARLDLLADWYWCLACRFDG